MRDVFMIRESEFSLLQVGRKGDRWRWSVLMKFYYDVQKLTGFCKLM